MHLDRAFLEKDTRTRMFTAALFTTAKTWKQPSVRQQMSGFRRRGVYTTEYDSATKGNKVVPLAATWLALETLVLSEVSQEEKDKYHTVSLVSGT